MIKRKQTTSRLSLRRDDVLFAESKMPSFSESLPERRPTATFNQIEENVYFINNKNEYCSSNEHADLPQATARDLRQEDINIKLFNQDSEPRIIEEESPYFAKSKSNHYPTPKLSFKDFTVQEEWASPSERNEEAVHLPSPAIEHPNSHKAYCSLFKIQNNAPLETHFQQKEASHVDMNKLQEYSAKA